MMQQTQKATKRVEPGPDDKVYPTHKLVLLLNALASEGVSMSDALAGVGVSEIAIGQRDTRISLNQMIAGHQNALRLSKDPSFAYRLGLKCHAPVHGMYGFALLSSTDFRRAIDFALQYSQLAAPLVNLNFHETSFSGVWTISPMAHIASTPKLYQYLVELNIGIQRALHREVMGGSFKAQQIRLTYGPPKDPTRYAEMLGCPVSFDQSENQILFDVDWLNRTPERGNEDTFSEVRNICDGLIEDFRLRMGLAGRVRQFLLENLPNPIRIGDAAAHFDVSARTLRRKLQDENTSYSQLIDDLRRDLAIQSLRDTDMTVDDIGYALGFSEPSNFRQAFRRWTQSTPSAFRTRVRSV